MVNTRAKCQKIENTLKICFSQSSMPESHHQTTQSGASVGSSDDLLTEILCRVPARSIVRFKCVSKHWLGLLSHPHFTTMYDILLISSGVFCRDLYVPFDVENRNKAPFRSLDFYPDLRGIRILQSCNGLLLCCSDRGTELTRKYYVFNPTTKQFALVPPVPGGPNVRKTIFFMGLAFHQIECVRYKIMCIFRPNPEGDVFKIQIYSSDIGKWKITNESFSAPSDVYFSNGVYWNGAIHWALSCGNLLCFRLEGEQLQELSLPSPRFVFLGESRGHLNLVETRHQPVRGLGLNVYEMASDHSEWLLKFHLELDQLFAAYPEMKITCDPNMGRYYCENFDVLDIVRGEVDGDAFMVVKVANYVIRYNLLDKSFKQFFDIPSVGYETIGQSDTHRYIETLGSF